jgi:hypothetical protein
MIWRNVRGKDFIPCFVNLMPTTDFRQAENQSPSGGQLIDEPNCKSFFRWVHL